MECELGQLSEQVAITGANGFIGRILHARLPDARVLNRAVHSLMGPASLESLLGGVRVIFHLAGVNAGSGYTPSQESMTQNNVLATWNLIEGIRRYAAPRPLVVLISSIHVYAKNTMRFTERSELGPSSYYGLTKLMQELLVRQAARGSALECVVFRAANVYGPGCRPYYNSAVATFCAKLRLGETLDLFGNGRSQVDLVYLDDVVSILLRAPELSGFDDPVFNLSSGQSVDVSEVVAVLGEVAGITPLVRMVDTPPVRFVVENAKLLSALGPIQFTDLRSGLRQTFEGTSANGCQEKV